MVRKNRITLLIPQGEILSVFTRILPKIHTTTHIYKGLIDSCTVNSNTQMDFLKHIFLNTGFTPCWPCHVSETRKNLLVLVINRHRLKRHFRHSYSFTRCFRFLFELEALNIAVLIKAL